MRGVSLDNAVWLLTGLAANRSFETGQPVRVADLLPDRADVVVGVDDGELNGFGDG